MAVPTAVTISILGLFGYLRVNRSSSPAYTSRASSGSTAETFMAFQPSDTTSTIAVQPGGQLILWSAHTGMFCRVADISSIPAATSTVGNATNGERPARRSNEAKSTNSDGNAPMPKQPRAVVQPEPRRNTSMGSASPAFFGRRRIQPPPARPRPPRSPMPTAASPTRGARVTGPPPSGHRRAARSPPARISIIAAGTMGVLCNQRDAGAASVIGFTGAAFTYQGSPLVPTGTGQLLMVSPGADASICPLSSFPLGEWQRVAADSCRIARRAPECMPCQRVNVLVLVSSWRH